MMRRWRWFRSLFAALSLGLLMGCPATDVILDIDPPLNVAATPGTSSVTVTWDDTSTGESGFEVAREVVPESELQLQQESFDTIGTVGENAESFVDEDVVPGTHYRYRVRTLNPSGPASSWDEMPKEDAVELIDDTEFVLSVSKDGSGGGSVGSDPAGISCGDACEAAFPPDETVVLSAAPDEDALFGGWAGCDSADGASCTVTMTEDRVVTAIFNLRDNAPPTADLVATPIEGVAPLEVNFDASGSSDPDGSIASFRWDFGDDSEAEEGVNVDHSYTEPGSYSATLTVEDDEGAVDTATVDIVVNVDIPDAALKAVIQAALDIETDPGLEDMLRLRSLDASYAGVVDLTGLEKALNLNELNLDSRGCESLCNAIDDLSPLASLGALERLNLDSVEPEDISPLADLTNLVFLDLSHNSVTDLSSLQALTDLTTLRLEFNAIDDLSPLSGFTGLVELDLSDNLIEDLMPLADVTALVELDLSENLIADLTPLAELTDLVSLDVHGNNIEDLSTLSGLTQLEVLDLNTQCFDRCLSDISPLGDLANLLELDLYQNAIEDISSLATLTNLIILDLSDQCEVPTICVDDITVLSNLVNLTELYIHSNGVVDLSALAGLSDLTTLDLSFNLIVDIGSLVANSGLGSGDMVDLDTNCLTPAVAPNATDIGTLIDRGVTVTVEGNPRSDC